ncbi:sulfotransferase family protein [Mangrovimonas spongiae]|uniref:Sulfotransferase n=1 Tax=Mangrovimonas spongiae TaxID=2494697 RepID=A0A3R9N8L6_9FLAO|nr:sulfotransferase [Mangrovimonas spongiae]RSK41511.1 sulfotransferase [Mangrovimonas spongiae]
MNLIKPNTFIIGAQKSATTSVYNWISQHPSVCGPSALKDYPFFLKEEFFDKGIESLQEEYNTQGFNNQKIVLQGNVQYIFDVKAIKKIYDFNPKAKLICVLREPSERALSAYKYFKKLNIEKLTFKEALNREEERSRNSLQAYFDFTYKAHGMYAQQLKAIFNIFPKNQLLVLLYDDVKSSPESVMDEIFDFLELSDKHPITYTTLNATGEVRYKFFQNLFFNKSKARKFIVDNLIDPFFPLHKRTKIRWAFNEWNTKKVNSKDVHAADYTEEIMKLKVYFKNEVIELENLLNRDLAAWKQ